jgi:N-acetyl-anhydromuramyl-L-alanine amidase AmpD
MDIGATEIDQWHRERGFSQIGYHAVIRRNGQVEDGRPIELAGAHARGKNAHSIGICLVGGINKEGDAEANFTFEQYETLDRLLSVMKVEFPYADICGHCDLPDVDKACPSFNVRCFNESR